jgi:hypothetical protein
MLDMMHFISSHNPLNVMDEKRALSFLERTLLSSLDNPVLLVYHFNPFKSKESKINNILWSGEGVS